MKDKASFLPKPGVFTLRSASSHQTCFTKDDLSHLMALSDRIFRFLLAKYPQVDCNKYPNNSKYLQAACSMRRITSSLHSWLPSRMSGMRSLPNALQAG